MASKKTYDFLYFIQGAISTVAHAGVLVAWPTGHNDLKEWACLNSTAKEKVGV